MYYHLSKVRLNKSNEVVSGLLGKQYSVKVIEDKPLIVKKQLLKTVQVSGADLVQDFVQEVIDTVLDILGYIYDDRNINLVFNNFKLD